MESFWVLMGPVLFIRLCIWIGNVRNSGKKEAFLLFRMERKRAIIVDDGSIVEANGNEASVEDGRGDSWFCDYVIERSKDLL